MTSVSKNKCIYTQYYSHYQYTLGLLFVVWVFVQVPAIEDFKGELEEWNGINLCWLHRNDRMIEKDIRTDGRKKEINVEGKSE